MRITTSWVSNCDIKSYAVGLSHIFLLFTPDPVVDGDPAKPKKSSKGKKAKKPEAKDLAMFDENAPSIFDDPLDALRP